MINIKQIQRKHPEDFYGINLDNWEGDYIDLGKNDDQYSGWDAAYCDPTEDALILIFDQAEPKFLAGENARFELECRGVPWPESE